MQPYRQTPCHKAYVVFHLFLFYNWKVPLAALRTAVIKAVELDDFQFRRNKDQFTTDKLFTNLNQRCITGRAKFIFIFQIKIFLCYWNPFETLGIRCSVFSFLDASAGSMAASSSASAAAGSFSLSASLKRFNCPGKSTGCFSLEVPKSFLRRRFYLIF